MRYRSKERESSGHNSLHIVMPGLDPGIHAFLSATTWMAGHGRAEATPSFGRLFPIMTEPAVTSAMMTGGLEVAGISFVADLSGALFWDEQRLLVVSDLHLEKGSSFAARGVLLPPYDTVATLSRLSAVVARHDPRMVIALGDSFHDHQAHRRLSKNDREALSALQARREWIWISGNHDPALPSDLGGIVATEVAIGPIHFRHEPTGAFGEIAGHLHPKARVATRGRAMERRCFASDGERAVMPAFGAYAGGLSIRDAAFAKIFASLDFMAHVLGDIKMHTIAASRCY